MFAEEWRQLLDRRMVHWRLLDDTERTRLEADTVFLLDHKRWEAARGFELTTEIRVLIAAQASLLLLGLHRDAYRKVRTILVHRTTQVLTGPRPGPAPGVVADGPLPVLGHTNDHGPVVIAWDAARADARHPERGHNVVYHEFAHQLDLLDGMVDGTPPLGDRTKLERWVRVCTAEYEALRRGERDPLLRDYAGVNVGEFFAVATEVFFDRPVALEQRKPDLYEVLASFYHQDPAARERRASRGL